VDSWVSQYVDDISNKIGNYIVAFKTDHEKKLKDMQLFANYTYNDNYIFEQNLTSESKLFIDNTKPVFKQYLDYLNSNISESLYYPTIQVRQLCIDFGKFGVNRNCTDNIPQTTTPGQYFCQPFEKSVNDSLRNATLILQQTFNRLNSYRKQLFADSNPVLDNAMASCTIKPLDCFEKVINFFTNIQASS
jgi:hypothetical protein